MDRVIVTGDFAGTIKELSEQLGPGRAITYTQEEYGHAGAKLVFLPSGNDFAMVLVFSAQMVEDLTLKQETPEEKERVLTAIHSLNHEFVHVHDTNMKVDAFSLPVLSRVPQGKEAVIFPLAEACWSEYIANYFSSGTATSSAMGQMAEMFQGAVKQTKLTINKEILSYRRHADLDKLMGLFRRHGEWLPKVASYLIGYVHGSNKSLAELSPHSAESLSGSYFEETWCEMSEALERMREGYPHQWTSLAVYDGLAAALDRYYAKMGLNLSTMENGRCYVNIPFRPETTLGQ